MMRRLLLSAVLALSLSGVVEAQNAGPGLYWQCVPPGPSSPNGGFCPVNSTYPLPVTATFSGTVGLVAGSQVGVQALASAGGLATEIRIPSVASGNNLTSLKSSAGRIYKIVACNTTSSYRYAKFYNIASGSVTVGTSTVAISRAFPPNQCASYDMSDLGWYFSNSAGFSFALTTGTADTDSGSLTAGDLTQVAVGIQ